MLSQLLTQTCVITRRLASASLDAFGNEVPDEEFVESACLLQQGAGSAGRSGSSRTEQPMSGEVASGRWVLYLPAGTDVTTADRVTVGGHVFEFVGDPEHVWNARTAVESHVEATVFRSAGAEDAS